MVLLKERMGECDNRKFQCHNILLSCDDGIDSKFVFDFYEKLKLNNNVVMILPNKNVSLTSAAVTVNSLFKLERINNTDEECYSLNGYTTDCIAIGCSSVMPIKFDIVICGINYGLNLGDDVFYSSNFMAAREAAIEGKCAIVISAEGMKNMAVADIVNISIQLLDNIHEQLESGYIYNINLPDCKLCEMKEIIFTVPTYTRNETDFKVLKKEKTFLEIMPANVSGGYAETSENEDLNAIKNKKISITKIKKGNIDFCNDNVGTSIKII